MSDDIANFEQTGIVYFSYLIAKCHRTSREHGFYESIEDNVPATKIALMHSEASEILEALRKAEELSEKIPGFTLEEEEVADLFIRLADYSVWRGLRLGEAIVAKMRYNDTRPYKHGKAF